MCDPCKGSRTHIAVTRDGQDCALYINGQLSRHSASSVSVAYLNSNLVFGVDYRNRTHFYKGSMDNIAVYSQALSDSYVKALYKSVVQTLPSRSPTTQSRDGTINAQQPNADNKSGGNSCDNYCMVAIATGIGSFAAAVCSMCVAYHVYYLGRRDRRTYAEVGNNSISPAPISPRRDTFRI
jgi:hypothetical protein